MHGGKIKLCALEIMNIITYIKTMKMKLLKTDLTTKQNETSELKSPELAGQFEDCARQKVTHTHSSSFPESLVDLASRLAL